MATKKNRPATAERNPVDENRGAHTPQTDIDKFNLLWEQFETCQPLMTEPERLEINDMLFSTEARRAVTVGLFMLTHTGRTLLDAVHSGPEMVSAFEELAECAQDRAAKFRVIADALDTLSTRLVMALSDA